MSEFRAVQEITEHAILCKKKCACLEKPSSLCPVDESLKDIVFFIKPKDDEFCPYKICLNDRYYCDCPVRKEIYKQYGI